MRNGQRKSPFRQSVEKTIAALLFQFSPEEYRLYECFRSEVSMEDIGRFFPTFHVRFSSYRRKLNDRSWRHILENKWVFHLHMKALNIRVAPLVAAWFGDYGVSSSGRLLSSIDELGSIILPAQRGIVVKPIGGQRGIDVTVLPVGKYNAAKWHDTVVPLLSSGSRYRGAEGFIIEECIEQDECLNELSPYALNTIRVNTVIDSQGKCRVHGAALRLSRPTTGGVDNLNAGGIKVPIDHRSGTTGDGKLLSNPEGRYSHHPDTGVKISGRQIPQWEKILELAARAATAVPQLRSVGWDIAVSKTGPVLIEGNHDWDARLPQGYDAPHFTDDVKRHLYGLGYGWNWVTRLQAVLSFILSKSVYRLATIIRR